MKSTMEGSKSCSKPESVSRDVGFGEISFCVGRQAREFKALCADKRRENFIPQKPEKMIRVKGK